MNATNKLIILALVLISCLLCVVQSQQEEADKANEEANARSLQILENLPRYQANTELDLADINGIKDGTDYSYPIGIASVAGACLVIPLLGILICPFWCLCRTCQCCCCKKNPPKSKITAKNIWCPYIFMLLLSITMVVMAGIAYSANKDFSDALIEGKEQNLFQVGINVMDDGASQLMAIASEMEDLKISIMDIVEAVQEILNNTSILEVGTNTLLSMLGSIATLWADYNVTATYNSNTYTFVCDFCTTISDEVSTVESEISDQTDTVFADLSDTISNINTSLIGAVGEIVDLLDQFIELMNTTTDTISTQRDYANDDVKPQVEKLNNMRELAYMVLFAIPLVPIVFVLLGGLCKKPICFTINYILLWLSFTIMFILLAIHVGIAVVLQDICVFSDKVEKNVTMYLTDEKGLIIESCLSDTKLLDALNMSSMLNFSGQISFPDFGDISEQFTFADLVSFEDSANDVDIDTFYEQGDEALEAINNLTYPDAWARDNVSSLDPVDYYPNNTDPYDVLVAAQEVVLAESAAITAFNDTLNNIRANLSNVLDQVDEIQESTQQLVDDVNNASTLLTPLFDQVDDIIDSIRCGFLGDGYYESKAIMCGSGVLGSLARIVVAMMVVGICAVFSCCCSASMVRRIEWYNKQLKEEEELQKYPQQVQQPIVMVMPQPGQAGMMGYGQQFAQPYGQPLYAQKR
jgi:archaellum component FlaC